ncbi:hypothetical protein [Bernardetia sp. MNP-M8]|uniref:hypothetical protein n=1 Tax=Bernardetia sp. MNP-M8 TaxID=3127470 RepID=UPI0030D20BDF
MNKIIYFFFFFLIFSCKSSSPPPLPHEIKRPLSVWELEIKNLIDNKLSESTRLIVQKMTAYNIITSSHISYSAIPSEQWKNFEELKKQASSEELILLMDYPNSSVKGYTFLCLLERKELDVYPILKKHYYDTNLVTMQEGCIIYRDRIGNFFVENSIASKRIKENEVDSLKKIALYDKKYQMSYKNELLIQIEPNETDYERIREIAIVERNPIAVLALSKYKQDQDKELIKSLINNEQTRYFGIRCVIHFPDTEFFPLLESYHDEEIKKRTDFSYTTYRVLYKAIVQYQNQESIYLLKKTLTKATNSASEYHKKYIWIALTKYPNSIYNEIFNQLDAEIKQDSLSELYLQEIEID